MIEISTTKNGLELFIWFWNIEPKDKVQPSESRVRVSVVKMRVFKVAGTFLVLLVAMFSVQPSVYVAAEETENFEFQAEVSRLMDIIINSLYQKKEIFLREVISNGADALDKIRFLALSDPDELGEGENKDLEMRISFDTEERTLTIRDRGVGMTKNDLIENLGTVAKSGTTNFVEQIAEGGDLSLIGQFGVGFYSVYLVADKVQVRSKNNNDDQYIWTSTADSTFSVAKDPEGNTLGRGTEITLFLKEDALEYADQLRLEELVKRYSEFISFPIYLHKEETEYVDEEEDYDEEDDEGEDDDDDEDDDELEAEDEDDDDDQSVKEVTTWKWVRVNDQTAIWTRAANEVSDDEYKAFYKSISKDFMDPFAWTHFRGEGEVEFKSILFIPTKPPYNMYDNYYNTNSELKLFVRKVLIRDDFEDLMPRYLNFVKGVVDSDDLPLSVSRETLQQHKAIKVIGKKLVRKTLDMLRKMAEAEKRKQDDEDDEDDEDEDDEDVDEDSLDSPRYSEFFENFGKNIKLGVVEDSSNKNRLSKLLRYRTTKSDELISLEEYVRNMPDWQKDIYFLAGEDMESIKNSPFLEKAIAKGVEVILMDDPVDEYVVQNLPEFEGAKLKSLAKEGVKFGDETEDDKKREKLYKKEFKGLCDWLKTLYTGKVEKVVVSKRVTGTPSVLVSSQFGHSANMERIMKSQAFGDKSRMQMMLSQKTMEINPRHPIVAELKKLVEEDEENAEAKDIAWLLFDTSTIASGFDMGDPKEFSSRMYRLMQSGMKLDSLDLLEEIEIPEEDDEEEAEDLDADVEEKEL